MIDTIIPQRPTVASPLPQYGVRIAMDLQRSPVMRLPQRRNILLGGDMRPDFLTDMLIIDACPLLDNLADVFIASTSLSIGEMSERYAIAEKGAIRAMLQKEFTHALHIES